MYCVVGLGNPGREYRDTRHNLGFKVLDRLAEGLSVRIRRRVYRALTATVKVGRSEVFLMKPQTYMNLSGRSVALACRELGIAADHLVLVYDEVDLPLGRLRVRRGGGSGGHKGVSSVIEEIGESDFVRVRLGVSRPEAGADLSDYLLSDFEVSEREVADMTVATAAEAVRVVLGEGVVRAMARYNGGDGGGE